MIRKLLVSSLCKCVPGFLSQLKIACCGSRCSLFCLYLSYRKNLKDVTRFSHDHQIQEVLVSLLAVHVDIRSHSVIADSPPRDGPPPATGLVRLGLNVRALMTRSSGPHALS